MSGRKELIAVRFPVGTKRRIKKIQDDINFGDNISDFIYKTTMNELQQNEIVLKDRIAARKNKKLKYPIGEE